jgi:hypothetical protein
LNIWQWSYLKHTIMDKVVGLGLLKKIIKDDLKHEDYVRVTDLADKYYKYKSGDDIESELQKIEKAVSEEEFEQIKRIYRSIIPPVVNSTQWPFQKAIKTKPTVRMIDFPDKSDEKKSELEVFIKKYWGDKSLEKYLEYAFIDYNYVDPNAFLITEFDAFDNNKTKASPYPFIADSKQAVMFEYKNEILQYLVVKLPNKYMDGDEEKDGVKFTMYLGMDTIVLDQVASSAVGVTVEINAIIFEIKYFTPKNTKVPAIRFGYRRDTQTKGRTFVSIFHDVLGYLEKTLKIDSELDMSCAMVAFAQRFMYVSPCDEPGCNHGNMPDGTKCGSCHGTGQQQAHKGVQDIITLTLPRGKDYDYSNIMDLEKMLVYKYPPIDLLNFQKEYLEYLKQTTYELMFNVDRFTRAQVAITATESIQGEDNLYDTLNPFAQHYSSVWEFVVKDIATFTDLNNGLIVQHIFPGDFKFKTLTTLMMDLKSAKDSGASTSTVAKIEDDINEKLYFDQPDKLKEIRIKNDLNPFRGYNEADIRFIISQGNTTIYARTLWENFEAIMQDLEAANENPWLYDLALPKIREKVREMTLEYIQQINSEKQAEQEQFIANEQAMNPGNAPV